MRKTIVIIAAIVLVALIFAMIVPLWLMTADMEFSNTALTAIVLMVIGCFGVGGGLMFLIFYSARKGHDDQVYHGRGRVPEE